MNVAGIHFIAAAAMLTSVAAQAQDSVADAAPVAAAASGPGTDTPYAGIIARNMFGLLPIPPPPDPAELAAQADPPPKITPNGIMTIFGRDQALFKVANKPKPGQQPKEDSYVLAEGERQDDIEVVKINHDTSVITFNNHGAIQELPLVAAKDTGGSAPGPGEHPSRANPGLETPRPGGEFPARGFGRTANRPAPGGGNPAGSPAIGGGQMGGGFGGGANQGQSQSAEGPMTMDQQEFLIEAQRKVAQDSGDPIAQILPPTAGASKQLIQQLGEEPPGPGAP